jgi:hypothetical protein
MAISSRSIVPPAITLRPEFLLRLGLSPQVKVLDLKQRVRYEIEPAAGEVLTDATVATLLPAAHLLLVATRSRRPRR